MSGNTATDGQDLGQEDSSSEAGAAGGETTGGGKSDRLADMEARFEMLQDSIAEMRNALLSSRTPAQPSPVDEIDDDEPLTPSKVKKIVQSSITTAVGQSQSQNERQVWDDKAKADFPLADPKFQLEVKKEWREQVASGLDPRHPKALYNVAKIVARAQGTVKKPATRDAETTHTSEAATTQRPASSQPGRRTPAVSDDDPRIRFYAMKGNKTKEQIEAQKKKLGERDAAKGARR